MIVENKLNETYTGLKGKLSSVYVASCFYITTISSRGHHDERQKLFLRSWKIFIAYEWHIITCYTTKKSSAHSQCLHDWFPQIKKLFDVSQQICNNDIYKSKGWLWINLNLLYSYIHYKLISLKKTWGMGLVGKVKCSTWDVARNPWESHISSTQYDLWGNSSVDTKCRIVSSHSTADVKVYGHIIGSNCARVANHHRYQYCIWRFSFTVHLCNSHDRL